MEQQRTAKKGVVMKRKIIIIVIIVAIILGAFSLGWYLKGRQTDNSYNSSLKTANAMVDSILTGEDQEAQYDQTSDLYRETIDINKFKEVFAPLKDAQIVTSQPYTGITDNFISLSLVKADKNYILSVSTTENDGKWEVTSITASEQTVQ
jgi:uncharacterized protein YpmB